ncbi:MAG TPA: rhomboid family intramembrane serine protease [Rhodanobacteraceae bacterium]|nr:rhomboid family intramembrane serine protease [Rhodanobacteraceae bacterium]
MDTSTPPPRDLPQLRRAALMSLGFVAVLWLVKAVELAGPGDFSWLGVYPRRVQGLLGILTAPLVHAGFEHLIFNTLPTFLLLTLALFNYPAATRRALPLIWLLSGVGVWLIGRPSWHFGASGLSHGLMFFLFFLGLLRQDRSAITIALAVFFLYGGMVMTVLPREPHVSWEAHLSGAVAGTLAALLWRRLDAPTPEPKRSWELEEEEEAARAAAEAQTFEPPRPDAVPVLWQRAEPERGVVLRFPPRLRPVPKSDASS